MQPLGGSVGEGPPAQLLPTDVGPEDDSPLNGAGPLGGDGRPTGQGLPSGEGPHNGEGPRNGVDPHIGDGLHNGEGVHRGEGPLRDIARARLRVDVLTIFPDLVDGWLSASLIGRARRAGLLDLRAHDLRSMAQDPHRSVDDAPFGGGPGMVLAPAPLFAAVAAANPPRPLLLLGAGGQRFDQAYARTLMRRGPAGFSLLCGRYEGVDQRVVDHLCDGEVSIGDFIVAGGEVGALAIIEAVARLVPDVMGNATSGEEESFSDGLLEYPQYTRPAQFQSWAVPEVLLSGDHGRIARWRRAAALARTAERRPDLMEARGGLSEADRRLLEEFGLMSYD